MPAYEKPPALPGDIYYLLTQFQTRKQPRPSGPAAVAAPLLWAGLHGACNRKTGNLNLTESTNTVDWEGLNENFETMEAELQTNLAQGLAESRSANCLFSWAGRW